MDLSFKELQKRDVVNVTDGKCLGHIVDLTLSFPKGVMIGISVPTKKCWLTRFGFGDRIFIESFKIKKIGSDVILVDLNAQPPKKVEPCEQLCNPCFAPPNKRDNGNFSEQPGGEYE